MTIENDRIETTVRLLSNGRYVWTITHNTSITSTPSQIAQTLKQMDGTLADAFPNHVAVSSFKIHEIEED